MAAKRVLTANQVAGIVIQGGVPQGTTAAQWVAKARQESHFDAYVEDFLHSGHWGLWQIGEGHFDDPKIPESIAGNPRSRKVFKNSLQNPVNNYAVTKILYNENGWKPWIASGGAPHVSTADKAAVAAPDFNVAQSGGGDIGAAIPQGPAEALGPLNPLNAFKTLIEPLMKGFEWLGNPGNWLRILQVTGGVALGLVALSIALKPVAQSVPKGIL